MIRSAYVDDCAELAALHVRAWQQAYAGFLPQEFLIGLDQEKRSEVWRQMLVDEVVKVFLDYDKTTLVGFAACGACLDSDATPTWGQLGALYYLKPYWGTGKARILYQTARSHLKASGYSTITLWVLDGNARAIAFYRKHGFDFDGEEKSEQRPGFTMRELRMVTQLS